MFLLKVSILRWLSVILVLGLTSMVAGCAQSRWNDASVQLLSVGDTKAKVMQLFGSPTSTARSSDGTETWIYRKAADSGGFSKNDYIGLVTLGLRSGQDAVVVDILKIRIKDDRVLSFDYAQDQDNTLGNAGQS